MKPSTEANEIKEVCRKSSSRRQTRLMLIASGMLWLLLVCGGLGALWSYESAPGVAANPPSRLPADSGIQPASGQATLVMLVHPHCPCTRASIGELALVMAQTQGRVKAYVLFLKPQGFSDEWAKSDLWESATAISGVTAIEDTDGTKARRFHAATSGQTFLYDARGNLLFSGGITAARGHSGDNAGRSSIVSLVTGGEAAQTETAVYGCELFNKNSECRMGEMNHAPGSH
ncbi:MAG: RedB protein [Pyrinomonadaceae bacterium]